MSRRGLWQFLSFFVLFLTALKCSEPPQKIPAEMLLVIPVSVTCRLCERRCRGGDEFLQHARAWHHEAYDLSFFSVNNLYVPLAFSGVRQDLCDLCPLCRFPVPKGTLELHNILYHLTSARSHLQAALAANSMPTSLPESLPSTSLAVRGNRKYIGPPMRSEAYLARFGPEIRTFDQYNENMQILEQESINGILISQTSNTNSKSNSNLNTKKTFRKRK